MRFISTLILGLVMLLGDVQAQNFGRNKVRYKQLDFEVSESPRFEIHHYLDNPERLREYASWCEHWYDMHQQVMKDTFQQKNPIILYNNHADFQQTTAISSMIGVGTGGVTEGLRNRVVLPFAMSNQQSYHVLGHELVHAFQYHKLINHPDTSISLKSIQNFPLWMVEGMAEHLSTGRMDAHTAMWMRDAVHNEDLPTLKQLSGGEYFPYRYGQAFWAFVTGLYGDTIVEPLFVNTAKYGLDVALDSVLNMSRENLSAAWHSALHTWYDPLLTDREEAVYGQAILDDENAGENEHQPHPQFGTVNTSSSSRKRIFSPSTCFSPMSKRVNSSAKFPAPSGTNTWTTWTSSKAPVPGRPEEGCLPLSLSKKDETSWSSKT